MGTFSTLRGEEKNLCQDGKRLFPSSGVQQRRDPHNCHPILTGRER